MVQRGDYVTGSKVLVGYFCCSIGETEWLVQRRAVIVAIIQCGNNFIHDSGKCCAHVVYMLLSNR